MALNKTHWQIVFSINFPCDCIWHAQLELSKVQPQLPQTKPQLPQTEPQLPFPNPNQK